MIVFPKKSDALYRALYTLTGAVVLIFGSYKIFLDNVHNFLICSKKNICFLFFITFCSQAQAQHCTFNSSNNNHKIITVCGNNCTNIILNIPHIKTTADYIVKTKSYTPYPYTTNSGFEMPTIYLRTAFSETQSLPFAFCFYDSVYSKFVSSSNGVITFDTTNATILPNYCTSAFQNANPLPNTVGVQCSANFYSPKASIYTAHCDLDPRVGIQLPSPPDRKIEFRTEGTAPCRRFIVSYYKIGTFGTYADANCAADSLKSIFQTVLYESTGIIEMYIEKYVCPAIYSSGGKATLGVQNWNRDKAVCAPGKNAQPWTAVQEAYQFIPSGGGSRYIGSSIHHLNGSFIANADTASGANGTLNLLFPSICPSNADTTRFLVRTRFKACPGNDTLTYQDTILLVKKNNIVATLTAPVPCSTDTSRTLVVNAGGDNFLYSLNGGAPQTGNTFTNVPLGANQILVTGQTSGCTALLTAFIGTANINLQTRSDTSICVGDAVVLSTNSNVSNHSWLPATGLNNANIQSPTASPTVTTSYIVTATQGNCTQKDTVTITVLPKPTVNAGADITVLQGDDAQLNGLVSNANSVVWSPAVFLSNVNTLSPTVVKPSSTTLYRLTATAIGGCTASDDVLVTVLPYCVEVKNAFTPNGDGINDLWQVYNNFACLQNVSVRVYNRYGGLVYQNRNYRNQWNGTYNGKSIPDATYYYQIDYTLITGKQFTSKGDVTLLR